MRNHVTGRYCARSFLAVPGCQLLECAVSNEFNLEYHSVLTTSHCTVILECFAGESSKT